LECFVQMAQKPSGLTWARESLISPPVAGDLAGAVPFEGETDHLYHANDKTHSYDSHQSHVLLSILYHGKGKKSEPC